MQSKIVFREMLSELKALADVQGNYLTKEDIKKFFPGDALNEEQFGLVCEYLVSQKIKVDGYEPAKKTPETAQKTVKEHAERASASNPETEKQEENSETQDGEGPDFLGMYLEELAEIEKLSETEEERLFFEAVNGDSMAKSTLAGQYLETVYELAMTYVPSCRSKIWCRKAISDCCLHLKIWRQSQIWKNTVSRCLTVSGKQWKRPLRCHRTKKTWMTRS